MNAKGWATGLVVMIAGAAVADAGQQARTPSAVVIEGKVVEVFRASKAGGTDALVQVEVSKSELGGGRLGAARGNVPGPGDIVYIHVPDADEAGLPAEGAELKAKLDPREDGGWEGRGSGWFEAAGVPTAAPPRPAPTPTPAPTTPPAAPGGSALSTLGLTADELDVQGNKVIRVKSVERSAPAGQAGLEVGDVIIGFDDQPLGSLDKLAARVSRGGSVTLMVVDINTGKVAKVPVDLGPMVAGTPTSASPSSTPPSPAPTPAGAPKRSLGITAEAVTLGQRTALKVARVNPGGAGEKAGLEEGDVLVAANGAPLTGPEQLAAALRKSGPTMTLTVRDTRTGKEVPVEVEFEAPSPSPAPSRPTPTPSPTPAPTTGEAAGLGAVTELVFLDTEAAVKVTEVTPNGPAAKAGIETGDVILQANGKAVLHPTELTEAVRQAGSSITLTVVDSKGGRPVQVKVDLGK